MGGQETGIYVSAPGIAWTRDAERAVVVDWAGDRSWIMTGIGAAMWDLAGLGYSFERLVPVVATLAQVSREEAETLVLTTLHRWQKMGLVCLSGENGCDQPGDQRRL